MVFSFTSPAESFLHPLYFLNKFQFADDHERQYVRKIAKLALNNKCRIYLLTNEVDTVYGFIALSIASTISMPCVVVDYLITSLPYRNSITPNSTIARFLSISLTLCQAGIISTSIICNNQSNCMTGFG